MIPKLILVRTLHNDYKRMPFVEKISAVILAIALVMGFTLRLQMYLKNRSLWLDTARLALNIIDKNYIALFGPLEGRQMAPVGFLIASKLVGSAFGYSELSLTLLPFLFAVGALILFLYLSVDVLGLSVASLAFIPFASCSTAIYYSGEFKQYSSDLFFSVLILFVTHRILKEQFTRPWIATFVFVGIISVWFSHTAIIMLAGTGLALFLNALRQRNPKILIILIISGLIVLLHYLVLYFLQIRPATIERMFTYWTRGFAPLTPLSLETLDWWYKMFVGYAKYPLGFHEYGAWFSLVALVIGFVILNAFKSRRAILYMFFFPVVLLIVLSIFHLYPILTGEYDVKSRFVLFTIPIAYVLVAIGINGFTKLFPKPMFVTAILGVLLVYPSINHSFAHPSYLRQEMRPLVSYLYHYFSPEDSVYVYARAVPAFQFYTRKKLIPFVEGKTVEPNELPKDLSRAMTGNRIWAIISHDYVNNHKIIQRELETRYGPVSCIKFPGAWLLLSRFSTEQDQSKISRSSLLKS